MHVDLGARVLFPVAPVNFLDYRFQHAYDVARVGINYKWDGGAVVAKYGALLKPVCRHPEERALACVSKDGNEVSRPILRDARPRGHAPQDDVVFYLSFSTTFTPPM